MEARIARVALLAAVLAVAMGARHSTPNFIVETADPQLCAKIGQAAENYRRELAVAWLGRAMPDWSAPCVMTVQVGPNLGAGGATTFVFDRGEVYGWRMTIQGSAERIFDSVLPHEITHMIFACHFRRPLPRWADEGGATSVEHGSEKAKHQKMLVQFLQTGRGIAFNQMFAMSEYPHDVMPLYAQAYSLAEYLIESGGRRKFLGFLAEGMAENRWSAAVQQHYGLGDLGALQTGWLAWVRQGSPPRAPRPTSPEAAPSAGMLAAVGLRPRPEPNLILRITNDDPLASTRPQSELQVPPASGWRPSGMRPAAPPAVAAAAPSPPGPLRTQLTHPQPIGNSE